MTKTQTALDSALSELQELHAACVDNGHENVVFVPLGRNTYVYEYVPKGRIHTYARTYVRTYVRMYVQTYVRTSVRPYARTYGRTNIQTIDRTIKRTTERTYLHTYVRTYNPTYVRILEKITNHFLANLNKRPGISIT